MRDEPRIRGASWLVLGLALAIGALFLTPVDSAWAGGCCRGGACSDVPDLASCTAIGGTYFGNVSACAEPIDCAMPPATGACCGASMPPATAACDTGTSIGCLTAGGTYQGDATTCSPDPCSPPAMGACCNGTGGCSLTDMASCTGSYQGDGTTCDLGMTCGACCTGVGGCTDTISTTCATTFKGPGTACSDVPSPCTGACCDGFGLCFTLGPADCTFTFDTYQGDGTTCGAGCAACCTGALCSNALPALCGGMSQAVGTYCMDLPPPCMVVTGACCAGDGSCTEVDMASCPAGYQGDGTTCAAGMFCGACCGASCVDAVPATCAVGYQGDGSDCTPDPCPPPTGACCLPSMTCSVETSSACLALSGSYQGDAVACTPGLCTAATKAKYGDFTGDGTADPFVWRKPGPTVPSAQRGTWYWLESPPFTTIGQVRWGIAGDIPLIADMEGDGKDDQLIWRPSTGQWFWRLSSTGLRGGPIRWGLCSLGDTPLVADMDGDGQCDPVVWRTGDVPPVRSGQAGAWYWLLSSTGYDPAAFGTTRWGRYDAFGDRPFLADMDGDGRGDPTVWRPGSPSTWYWKESSTGFASFGFKKWGQVTLGDVPILADIDADGLGDLIVFRTSTNEFLWTTSSTGYTDSHTVSFGDTLAGDVPLVLCLDGDAQGDLTVWRQSTVNYIWTTFASGYTDLNSVRFGDPTDIIPDNREREANVGLTATDWMPTCNP